ncbi:MULTISPECIES: GntR family transcriptional regulator [unclassified Rhodococcus (in: high G+C Gram-positive bacteria)]|jgi:GntR family transcriptional regulator|uniref:GntR family transcriptional regulator n=1 Tax=unclassified Rhodococcus (in: high G+C Gram-positive bacteria) TaxID=192944 RepID=UPI000AEA5104|nr:MULTISPECIES: GntR family transcriptional regulator [unclassified Rhodococcus (in: high G+C Gram-positive bacteria)]
MMSLPLHGRVADALRGQITDGTLPVGAPLPSEARLCALFDASRGTVRAALAALRHEGLIAGGRGRPPVVCATAVAQPFETFMSFTAWADSIGRVPGQRTLEVARRAAGPVAAAALGLDAGTVVIDVLRLRTLDGAPALLERSSFVESVGRRLFDFDPDSGSIYAYLIGEGVDLHGGRHTIDAVSATDVDAAHLDTDPGAPLLRERRRATDSTGTPLEYADDRYRPDRVAFTIDNTQSAVHGAAHDLRIVKESS